ncbi:MAG: porin [Ignavibacteria bacterium]|nr:porin [Ignavibacteria bacterium]
MKRLLVVSLFIVCSTAIAQVKPDYSPQLTGYVRAWYQSDYSTNSSQYLVKQARVSITGLVNEYAGYKFQVDLTRLGKLTTTSTTVNNTGVVKSVSASFPEILLDAAAVLIPFKNFELTAGQFKVPFSTDNLKSDQNHEFANRPLLASVSPNGRDIGFTMSYKFKEAINTELVAGSFNGSGLNKAETDKTMDYVLRGVISPVKDLNLAAGYYNGTTSGNNQNFVGFSCDYKYNSLLVGGEFANRTLSSLTGDVTGNSYVAFVTYCFAASDGFLKEIIPSFRYESYDPDTDKSNNEIGRITLGVTFEFAKITFAHFRINYEKFDYKDGTANPDKLILEIQTKF